MKRHHRHIQTKLVIIGAGLAGFAASIFAIKRGIATMQIGHSGALAYTTGYLDLLGARRGKILADPWAGLEALRQDEPAHPLARLDEAEIQKAFAQFTAALCEMGILYSAPAEQNQMALLPAGLRKPTLSLPHTMLAGVEAAQTRANTLILDFSGLAGFSAAEFKANFSDQWPRIETRRLKFPDMEKGQVFPEAMARALEVPAMRTELAARIAPYLGAACYVGLPAILGMHAPDEVHRDMERLLGMPVFEIPTIPPAVPGIRLRELFERALPERGIKLEPQLKVQRAEVHDEGIRLFLHGPMDDLVVECKAVVLATGRFLSGGLKAGPKHLHEALFDLPLSQPETRKDWYRQDYFDPRGHRLNRAGLEVDRHLRPLGPDRKAVYERVFAAGSVLAHQDWVRQRCGAGLAIATACRAVRSAEETL
jgi:glycerol-3-phosphate dehydrogenase subunit B